MDSQITIASAQETVILAYGTSSSPKRFWLWVLFGIIASITVAFIVFLLLLRPAFSFPKDTVAIAVTTPNAAQKLFSREALSQLPSPWREALSESSSWPVVIGLARKDGSFIPFVLAPRWIKTIEPSETHGLARLSGSVSSLNKDLKPVRYTSFVWQRLRHPFTPIQAHAETAHLFPISVSSTSFDIRATNRLITTTLPLTAKTTHLTKGDLTFLTNEPSIAHPMLETVRRTFFAERGFPPREMALESVTIDLTDAGDIERMILSAHEEFTAEQKSLLLSSLGVYNTQIFGLPDGTNSILSTIKPSAESTAIADDWVIQFEKNKLYLAKKSSISSSPSPVEACSTNFEPVLGLSETAVQELFGRFGVNEHWPVRALQIGSKDGDLAVCFE